MSVRKIREDMSISGHSLKKTLEVELDVLGPAAFALLIRTMEDYGFRFEKDQKYTAAQLKSFLRMVFGENAASVIMHKVGSAFQ